MKNELNRTTYNIKDLSDQTPATFLLRFETNVLDAQGPRTLSTTIWVDQVKQKGKFIVGIVNDEVVVGFSVNCEWFAIHKDMIDVLTYAELHEQSRKNIAGRVALEAQYRAAYKHAVDHQGEIQGLQIRPSTPSPEPSGKPDWDRLLRDLTQGDEGVA